MFNKTLNDQKDYSYNDVFGQLRTELFSAEEAANYLEISMPTLCSLVESKQLLPDQVIGSSQFFTTDDLKLIKSLKAIKQPIHSSCNNVLLST